MGDIKLDQLLTRTQPHDLGFGREFSLSRLALNQASVSAKHMAKRSTAEAASSTVVQRKPECRQHTGASGDRV